MNNVEDLIKEMKHIKALLAVNSLKDMDTKTDKILFLNRFGFEVSEIAKLVDSTEGSVSVAISRSKAMTKVKKKKSVSKASQGDRNDR